MSEPSRYARSKMRREAAERHASIVGTLGYDVRKEFDMALEDMETPPPCVVGGIPSMWTDWDSNPEYREPYETERPSNQAARIMCEACPLFGTGVCFEAALARGETHGVWEGRIIEEGKVVS